MPEAPTGMFFHQPDDEPKRSVTPRLSGDPTSAGKTPALHSRTDVAEAGTTSARQRGRYTIERLHAQGGLGQVNLAHEARLNRKVALKEIRPDQRDANARRRFLREAEITGRLEHPGIVPIYGLEEDEKGEPYYVMRFIQGRTLAGAIEAYHLAPTALAFRDLLQRLVAVCQTMAYAHNQGIIHRDLKPANIMLGDYGETLVVDWGMAKEIGSRDPEPGDSPAGSGGQGQTDARPDTALTVPPAHPHTQHGAVVGTPAYMSPEQARGDANQVGPAADVFCLGAVLYEILTNRRPYNAESVVEALALARSAHFESPRRVQATIPRPLEAICRKAMAPNPQDRYATAKDLAADIEHWLADEPVSAFDEPWLAKGARWARRHRAAVATAAAVLLTATVGLAVGLAVVSTEKNRTELARQGEEQQRIEADKQAKLAQTSERLANERATETAAVLDFVENQILAAARPKGREGGLGADVPLRKAVEAALGFVERSFADQPLIEARLRMTLGRTFSWLGEAKIAVVQQERARTLYTHLRGPDHPDTLSSMHDLAGSYGDLGRRDDALKLRQATLALRRTKLGPDHPDTLRSMNNLAVIYGDLGRRAEATALLEDALALMKAKLGPEHVNTLGCMLNLAGRYAAEGRHKDALELREQTFGLMKSKLGPHHPYTLAGMSALAGSFARVGRRDEAVLLLEEALTLQKANLGSDHPDTLATMNALAIGYAESGRKEQAVRTHQELLTLRIARLGRDHPDTLSSMHDLASAYAALASLTGGQLPKTLGSMDELASSYAGLGRHSEALKLREEILAVRKAELGPDHPDTLASMHNLACSYADLGRHSDALQLREATLALMKDKLGPNHPSTLQAMQNLANTYSAVRRHADALALMEETVALRKANLGPDHPDTLRSMHRLADCYGDVGRQLDAYRVHNENWTLRKARLGPDHPDTLLSMANVADRLVVLGRSAEAIPMIDDCLQRAAGQTVDPLLIPISMNHRLRHFAKNKDAVGCRQTAEMWEKLERTDTASFYTAACMRAVAAAVAEQDPKNSSADAARLAKENADAAMVWLRKAVAKGYKNIDRLKKDDDLKPLREREDYKNLLKEIEGK